MALANTARILDLTDRKPGYRESEPGGPQYPGDGAAPEDYASYSRALLAEQRAAVEPLWIEWTQNLLFFDGLQHWKWDRVAGAFRPPTGPAWKERPVRNLLVAIFRNWMAKATKNRTAMTCVPASTEPDDLESAALGEDVLRAKYEELNYWKIQRRALAWVFTTGNGWIMPYWNTESGKLMPLTTLVQGVMTDAETGMPEIDPVTGEPLMQMLPCPCDAEGNPLMDAFGGYDLEAEPAYVDIGDVGYRVISPFLVFGDPGAENEDEWTFCLIAEPMPLRDIFRRWPGAAGVVAEDTSDFDRYDHIIEAAAAGADTHYAAGRIDTAREASKGLVLHYYERPCPEYPEGRHWSSCGSSLLDEPGPLPDGVWPPVVHIGDIDVPGQVHRRSPMTAAVGMQREYNDVNAQIKEHHNLLLRGKWLVPLGSNIRRGAITNEPGEVIQHTPGLKPEMAKLEPLPAEVYAEREKIISDLQFVTGFHDSSMGKAPPGVTAGKAFLVLQEADDSDLGPLLESNDNATAKVGHLTLQIIQRFYEEPRLIRVAGANNRYRVRSFMGADLSGVADVRAQAGSSFPWSKVAMQQWLIETAAAFPQLFTDPETGQFDTARFRELLPIGGERAVSEADMDLAEAHREEDDFEHWDGLSLLPLVQPWQNHAVHRRCHANILKGDAFKRWPPEAQDAFMDHFMATEAVIQQMMMQQIAMQAQLMPGAKGGDTSGKQDAPPAGGPPAGPPSE